MKIAVYYYIDFSGAKRVVAEQVKGLKSLGNTVDIYTTDSADDIFNPSKYSDKKYLYKFSPKNLNIPLLSRFKSDFIDTFVSLRLLNKKIARDIDKGKYDIVLVHTDIRTQAPFLLRYLNTKNVYYCLEPLRNAHEYALRFKEETSVLNKFYENLNRWIRKRIDIKNARSADKILTLSLFARERIIAAYDLYPVVSYLGVNESVFKPINLKKKKQVLFVADKIPIYGYDLAKKAFAKIPVGSRPTFKVVSWKKNNNERMSDNELAKLYNESLLTLSLSKFDTFGLVPLESMACGVPVLALNVAGYRETILDNKTGFLVDFSPEEIAEKIIYCLNNQKEMDVFSSKGRSWIEEKWTWKIQSKRLNDLLHKYANET